MENANRNLGEYYSDRQEWQKAIEHYEKINAFDRLVDGYIFEEKYDALISLIDKIDDKNILLQIARCLETLAYCKEAVKAYIKSNNFELAINACVNLNEWKMATELANQYRMKNIDTLLDKYVQHLEADQKYIEMIEVFK